MTNNSAEQRRSVARHAIAEWLGRSAMADLIELFAGRSSDWTQIDNLESQVESLEEFADFCWNFRQGVPNGVLHLLKGVSQPETDFPLPALASPHAWNNERASDLLEVYIGSEGPRDLLDRSEALRSQVDRYPEAASSEYRERWEAADLPIHADVAASIHRSAEALDIVVPGAVNPPYEHVLVLGGGGKSPGLRAEFAAEILADEQLANAQLWFLGSPRFLDEEHERPLVSDYAPDSARDEFDLMTAAALRAFGGSVETDEALCGCTSVAEACPQWAREHGTPPASMPVAFQHRRQRLLSGSTRKHPIRVLSASTSQAPDRPNTADTYELFADTAGLGPSDRVLIVTTQVFVPFQRFDALRMLHLSYGASVDVTGFGAERGDRPSTPEFELQEVLSGVRSARRLISAIS